MVKIAYPLVFVGLGGLAIILRRYIFRKVWCHCRSTLLAGKTVVITGATSGIGYEVAKELAKRGARILIGGRDLQRGQEACESIIAETSNKSIEFVELDLESLDNVDAFVDQVYKRVENLFCLINNAACFYLPPKITADGLERTYQTNYLSTFHLTNSLLPLLGKGPANRIINVSSAGHLQAQRFPDWDYHTGFTDCVKNRFSAYFYSKLCLVAYSWQLGQRLNGDLVSVHCVDPGNTETSIYRHFPPLSNRFLFYLQKPLRYFLIKTPAEGAQGVLHAILSPKPLPFYIEDTHESGRVNPLIYDLEKWTEVENQSMMEGHQADRNIAPVSDPGITKSED